MKPDRTHVRKTLLECLEEAGKILKNALLDRHVVTLKGELNIVTETDRRAEDAILGRILHRFPDHAILTEESPARGKSPFRWIIDPLDGTTNFAHTFPAACVSIAFEDHGQTIFGGVFDPFRGELFLAERGNGATVNDKPLVVSQSPVLESSLLCTGFPYDVRQHIDEYVGIFKAFLLKALAVRRTGSAALDLAYLAAGRFDGFWEAKLRTWDIAAASLLIEEAGGKLSDFAGRPLNGSDPKTDLIPQTVASNGFLHEEMLEVLKPFVSVAR